MMTEGNYQVAPFDGTSDVREFIHHYEVKAATWSDAERCKRLGQYLSGTAARWNELMTLEGGNINDKLFDYGRPKDWNSVRQALITEFDQGSTIRLYRAEQTTDESGLSFLYRLLSIYQENHGLLDDKSLIELSISKMRNDYKLRVKEQRPKSLKDLKEICKFLDENVGLEGRNKVIRKAGKKRLCYKCRKKGHVAKECTNEKKRKK
jgi:hypothetical protein